MVDLLEAHCDRLMDNLAELRAGRRAIAMATAGLSYDAYRLAVFGVWVDFRYFGRFNQLVLDDLVWC